LLRSNVTDWSGEELWRAYIQLTEAIYNSDRYGTRKGIACRRTFWSASWLTCHGRHSGRCAAMPAWDMIQRTGFPQLRQIQLVEVVLPTRAGVEIRKRCISRPTEHQASLTTPALSIPFFSTPLHALKEERHFALVEGFAFAFQPLARS
jgi:hypothetical protein